MSMKPAAQSPNHQLDWFTILVPLGIVLSMAVFFMVKPDESAAVLEVIRGFLGDDCGILYAVTGFGSFAATAFLAFSRYGKSSWATRMINRSIPASSGAT